MSYEVRCECGKKYPIGAADAGVSFPCSCGRTVDVPALHALRGAAGEKSVSPFIMIQSGFLSGELPGPPICVCCKQTTNQQIKILVVCERGAGSDSAIASTLLSGCLMFITGIFIFSWIPGGEPSSRHSSSRSVIVPVFVCEACDRDVTTAPVLRQALTVTPIYAALLEKYPDAEVRRVH